MLQKLKNHIWKGASNFFAIVNVVTLIVTSTFVANMFPLNLSHPQSINIIVETQQNNNWKVTGLLE
jgi:hypothetical protein